MIIIKSIAIIYYFLIVPILFGIGYNKFFKNKIQYFSDIYIKGYMVYLALFWLVFIIPMLHPGLFSIDRCIIMGRVFAGATGIILFFYIARDLPGIIKIFLNKNTFISSLSELITIAVCLLLFMPGLEDNTIERIIGIYASGNINSEGINLFYAIGNGKSIGRIIKVIHMFMPIVLLPLFFETYKMAARLLFNNDTEKQRVFLYAVILFFGIFIFADVSSAFEPFLNIWYAPTLATTIIFPNVLIYIIMGMEELRKYKAKKKKPRLDIIIMIPLCMMASQLCVKTSVLICALAILGGCILLAKMQGFMNGLVNI